MAIYSEFVEALTTEAGKSGIKVSVSPSAYKLTYVYTFEDGPHHCAGEITQMSMQSIKELGAIAKSLVQEAQHQLLKQAQLDTGYKGLTAPDKEGNQVAVTMNKYAPGQTFSLEPKPISWYAVGEGDMPIPSAAGNAITYKDLEKAYKETSCGPQTVFGNKAFVGSAYQNFIKPALGSNPFKDEPKAVHEAKPLDSMADFYAMMGFKDVKSE